MWRGWVTSPVQRSVNARPQRIMYEGVLRDAFLQIAAKTRKISRHCSRREDSHYNWGWESYRLQTRTSLSRNTIQWANDEITIWRETSWVVTHDCYLLRCCRYFLVLLSLNLFHPRKVSQASCNDNFFLVFSIYVNKDYISYFPVWQIKITFFYRCRVVLNRCWHF